MEDAYDQNLLGTLHSTFEPWWSNRAGARRYLSYNGASGLRGRRVPIGLPLANAGEWALDQADTDAAIFNPAVVASARAAFDAVGARGAPALGSATFIHSSSATSDDQEWHQDYVGRGSLEARA